MTRRSSEALRFQGKHETSNEEEGREEGETPTLVHQPEIKPQKSIENHQIPTKITAF
jgi:hypothetical protein